MSMEYIVVACYKTRDNGQEIYSFAYTKQKIGTFGSNGKLSQT